MRRERSLRRQNVRSCALRNYQIWRHTSILKNWWNKHSDMETWIRSKASTRSSLEASILWPFPMRECWSNGKGARVHNFAFYTTSIFRLLKHHVTSKRMELATNKQQAHRDNMRSWHKSDVKILRSRSTLSPSAFVRNTSGTSVMAMIHTAFQLSLASFDALSSLIERLDAQWTMDNGAPWRVFSSGRHKTSQSTFILEKERNVFNGFHNANFKQLPTSPARENDQYNWGSFYPTNCFYFVKSYHET